MKIISVILSVLVMACAGCESAPVQQSPEPVQVPSPVTMEAMARVTAHSKFSATRPTQSGKASYYADRYQGRSTASGEPYDKNAMTAAHRKLAFGTRVRVTNTTNGKSVVVRINDRGPFAKGRVIDLSRAAFSRIGNTAEGLLPVTVEVLD